MKAEQIDITITMQYREAKILSDAFGNKSPDDNEKYFKNKEVVQVIESLVDALDTVLKEEE